MISSSPYIVLRNQPPINLKTVAPSLRYIILFSLVFAFTYSIGSLFFLQNLVFIIIFNVIFSLVSLILFFGILMINDQFSFYNFCFFWIFAIYHLSLAIVIYSDGRNAQKYLYGSVELGVAFAGILFGTVGFNYMYRMDAVKRMHQILPLAAVSSL